MPLLSAGNICKSFGTDIVLNGISFEVRENDHIGLIGSNGTGKTTLFKILTGSLQADSGTVSRSSRTRLGYMEQHVCHNLERRAYDEVMTVFQPLLDMEHELDSISNALQKNAKGADKLIERQSFLTDRFNMGGGSPAAAGHIPRSSASDFRKNRSTRRLDTSVAASALNSSLRNCF